MTESDPTDTSEDSHATADSHEAARPHEAVGSAQTVIRTVCVLTGLAVIGVGAWQAGSRLGIESVIGLLGWTVAAVILHDGILVPALTLVGRFLFGSASTQTQSLSSAFARALAITRALTVVACLISAVTLPEIWAQGRGTANPTILPGDYAENLLGVWTVVLGLSAIVLVGGILSSLRRARRR